MNELSGSRILITGGAGFVGSFLAEQLIYENVENIILLDNMLRGSQRNVEAALSSGRVRLVEGDIRDRALLDDLMAGVDFCFHMAALRITQCAENPREALEVMFEGAFNVFEACVEHSVKKIVTASSASIYGQAEVFPTSECHPPYNNRTLYGAGKIANEQMLRSFHDMFGLNYCAMRYFNVYGPRMDTEGKYTEVLIRWYNQIKNGKPPLIFGDGTQTMDFVYVKDVARANVLAIKADATDEVYNIAGQREISLKELCFSMLEAMGSNIEPEFIPLPKERNAVEVYRRFGETSKAAKEIGFEVYVDLNEGLRSLVNWLDTFGRN